MIPKVPNGGTSDRKLLVGVMETRSQRRHIMEGDEALTVGSQYVIEASLSYVAPHYHNQPNFLNHLFVRTPPPFQEK